MLRTLSLAAALTCTLSPQDSGPLREQTAEEKALVTQLAEQQITLDPVRAWAVIPADVLVRDDLLEYLLVGPGGAAHEAALMTPVNASVLNVALLALGATPGTNATWTHKDPKPSDADLRAGVSPYEVTLPTGTGFYLYLGWRAEGETYFFRVEDLMRNLATGQAMKRHEWVFLGSRMVPSMRRNSEPAEEFAADVYQNLINVAFFREGYTLLTGALPDCVDQGIWMLNSWLTPERGSRVAMVISRRKIDRLTAELDQLLPEVSPPATEPKTR